MTRKIEVCSNNEWVGHHMLSELGLEHPFLNEASDEWFSNACRLIDDHFGEDITVASREQRSMYHGWNGANTFTRKDSGLGTFSEFTDAEWEAVTEIAVTEAGRIVEEYSKD
jgi:hypothetical protein